MNNEFDNSGWSENDFEAKNEQGQNKVLIGNPTEFKTLFWTELVIMISFAVILALAFIIAMGFTVIAFVVMSVASVVYLVYVLKLKRYSDTFKEAGIYYLIYFILYVVHNNVGGLLLAVVNIAYFVCLILYIIKFSDGCMELLKNRDSELADSWGKYKTFMLFAYAVAVVCELLFYIPGLNMIAAIPFIVIGFFQLACYIWHIALLNKTDAALRTYRSSRLG